MGRGYMGPKQRLAQAHILTYPCVTGQGGALVPFSVSAFIISYILQKFFYLNVKLVTVVSGENRC